MYIDIILGILMALGFYIGYSRGIIKTVFAIVSLLMAILAAMKLSPVMISFLDGVLSWDPRLTVILGFVLTFIVVVIAIRFLGNLLEKMMTTLQINFVNKLAGGIVMSAVFMVFFSCVVWFMDETRLLDERTKSSSMSYTILEPLPKGVAALGREVKPFFQSFWNKTADAMDRIREKSEEPESE
jgi:membrane protein required for colicin V production